MSKPFSQDVINEAWHRAGGKCECKENCHNFLNPCNKTLDPSNKKLFMLWHAHHIDSDGPSILSNCKILCVECHKKTRSYGR